MLTLWVENAFDNVANYFTLISVHQNLLTLESVKVFLTYW